MACGYRFWQESGSCLKAETGSGEEALNLLKKDYFDLVITDLRMMAGEGILLAEAMKRQGCTASLVLSGSLCSFESAREGMRLGALDFIPKPVTERKLSEALDGILHGQALSLAEYQEGEFAVLQDELQKMIGKLKEQAEILTEDKKSLSVAMADISH